MSLRRSSLHGLGLAQQFGAIHNIGEKEFFEGTPLVLPGESLRIPGLGIAQQFGAIHNIGEREFVEGTPLVLPGESLRIPGLGLKRYTVGQRKGYVSVQGDSVLFVSGVARRCQKS